MSVDLERQLVELAEERGLRLPAERLVRVARDVAAGRPAELAEALSAIADAGLPVVVSGRWLDAYGTLEAWLKETRTVPA